MNKPLRMGVATVRNEEKYIERWAHMIADFCDHVVALVDPDTSDNTVKILEEKCPWVEIVWQDRSLGDSDDGVEGPSHTLIMHTNKTKWIQDNIADEEWYMEMAVDEYFAPKDRESLCHELAFARANGFDAIVHRQLLEPVIIDEGQIERDNNKWYYNPKRLEKGKELHHFLLLWPDYFQLEHARIQQKHKHYKHNDRPHSAIRNTENPLFSSVPIWHYHRLKHQTVLANNWREGLGAINRVLEKGQGRVQLVPMMGTHNYEYQDPIDPKDYLRKPVIPKKYLIGYYGLPADVVTELKKLPYEFIEYNNMTPVDCVFVGDASPKYDFATINLPVYAICLSRPVEFLHSEGKLLGIYTYRPRDYPNYQVRFVQYAVAAKDLILHLEENVFKKLDWELKRMDWVRKNIGGK